MQSFFIYGQLPLNVATGAYQFPLVLLSYAVASFASYTALSLAQQLVVAKSTSERRLFHWGGAFAMGAGIWSMHFIGMLSYRMHMVLEYDPGFTLLSMLIAVAVAYEVLAIIARKQLPFWHILVSGVLLGFGICSMHYTGMAAMKMDGDLRYMPGIFLLSVMIAIAASSVALWIAFTLARHSSRYRYLYQIGAALIMGAGICGMHYTGMIASVFIPHAGCRYDANQNFDALALSIAGITSVILGLALATGFYKKIQTELLLISSEGKLRAVIDNALDAVIIMDQRGIITDWNKQAEAIFGWSCQEATGQPLASMIIPPEYREAHHKGLQKFLADGAGPILNKRIEISALNRRGEYFPVELTITAQKFQDAYHFTAFIRDISERRQAEAKLLRYTRDLERSNKDLDDFAYIASHDMKEPLRGLFNNAKFLQEDYRDKLDAEGIARLQRLEYLTQRMEQLVNDLLYFSRLGRQELAVQQTDLNTVIHTIESMMEVTMKEQNAAISVPQALPQTVCDKTRVTEIFRNLITNGVKYNKQDKKIIEIGYLSEMKTKNGLEKQVFYVKDNGIGIEEEFYEEIFRIFKRLNVESDDKRGTGVGLTFVRKIVERHGGHIWVESVPGKGTTFYFTLTQGITYAAS